MCCRDILGLMWVSSLLFTGCTDIIDHKGKHPIVQIGNDFLYEEDVYSVIPPGISAKDSTEMADKYIRSWIDDALLFDKAEGNIPDNAKIDRLVSSYRRNLITHTYIDLIVNQEVGDNIPDSEIEEYYNNNKNLFLTEEPYVQGLYMKVPLTAKGVSNVRKWFNQNSEEALDNLEKYSLRNAVDYLYFYDTWKPLDELMLKCPISTDAEKAELLKAKSAEVKDTSFYYFIHLNNIVNKGETLPLEYASGEIRKMLVNVKRMEFISGMKNDLYKNAMDNNEIKYLR